jgi:hypothetical protein
MRPFVHPLGLFVLLAGAIAAVVVEDRAGWSSRAPWIAAWTLAGYAALVCAQLIAGLRSRETAHPTQATPPARSALEGPGSPALEPESPALAGNQDDIAFHMQEALRRLNNPAALGDCALAHRLPKTITAFGEPLADPTADRTSLSRARALRSALVAGIEELRTAGGHGIAEMESLRYTILHEEYVLGRPNQQIMMRHNISESTFHRYRREAARLLGQELGRRERLLATEPVPSLDVAAATPLD